jgi:hypothetical protein
MLAEHDQDRGGESRLGLSQQREQELFLQVDVAAQGADGARQLPRVGICRRAGVDPRIDLLMLAPQRQR